MKELDLAVEVEDISASNGRQIAYTTLSIVIEDVNDNIPKFNQRSYRGAVTENTVNGTNVLKVSANGADIKRSIHYKLESENDVISRLKIDRTTGQIMVGGKIDHEQLSWLNFTVRATDSGVPPKSNYADVFIRVRDENDNSPIFLDFKSKISVKEDVPVGHIIMKVSATDKDEGEFGRVTYFLDSHSTTSKFQINPTTGKFLMLS